MKKIMKRKIKLKKKIKMKRKIKFKKKKPICTVFDSNIWISERLLKSTPGRTVVFDLKIMNGFIGVPIIIKEEVLINTARLCIEAESKINSNLKLIGNIISRNLTRKPFDKDVFNKAVNDRFDDLRDMIKIVPFTECLALASMKRVFEELPPNGPKNQQFKDSAIWEAILILSELYNVHFITNDKMFYKDKNIDCGLAENLKKECDDLGITVSIFPSLESYLEKIGNIAPKFDFKKPSEAIDNAIREQIQKDASIKNFIVGDIQEYSIIPYLTDRANIIILTFKIQYRMYEGKNIVEAERLDPKLMVSGVCSYKINESAAYEIGIDTIEYRWVDAEGIAYNPKSIFIRVGENILASDKLD